METRQVVVLMMASFLTVVVASDPKGPQLPQPEQLAAFAVLTVGLLVATDMDSLAVVGNALAWLIFLSVMLLYGERFFSRISSIGQVK